MGLAFLGAMALAPACNAIVGNGDIQFASDGGPGADATAGGDASAETAAPTRDGGDDDAPSRRGDADATDVEDADATAPEDGGAIEAGCEAGTKRCGGLCAAVDDPAYGCGAKSCAPCELPNAVASCALGDGGGGTDGGANGATFACSIAVCKDTHRDCNEAPIDGCEIDISDNFNNCGGCGIGCANLPHVAGNVTCAAGICSFDRTACAPGYGICATTSLAGCDTAISDPAHCGSCTTTCGAGVPYCSPSGVSVNAFTCTSGCAPGLSLCGGSCVNENTDPAHCGDCNTPCPPVSGGTSTCSGTTPSCGFVCNANNHLCGVGSTAFCAANNDANNCGTGAACTSCSGPANSTTTCSGGTTCGYACDADTHPCGAGCALDSDPVNCGTLCGTNCPGPTSGTGSASCNGNDCAITCAAHESLCGTSCVDELTDNDHCGSCGVTCSSAQTCSGGHCVCNAATCPLGCCDANQICQPAACGSGGGACAVGCPTMVPEAGNLVLWLVGDTYVSGASTWFDQSGQQADATCVTCASTAAGPNGHVAVSFGGTSYFALSDPRQQYMTQSWTILVVAAPDPGGPPNAQLLAFSNGSDSVGLQRSGSNNDLMFQVLPGSSTNSLVVTGAWTSTWERITAAVDATQAGSLSAAGFTTTGTIGSPTLVDYLSSYLGTDPASHTQTYVGQVAEIIVFDTTNLPSASNLQTYLSNRYNLP